MLTRIAVWLLESSPALRRLLWRWWYGRLARQFTRQDWTFMNYGYVPEAGAAPLALSAADEPDRYCIQLYAQVAAPAGLAGKDVVEVGSGRGGGASYLARMHGPKKYTGIDYSADAVVLCRQRHAAVANLEFIAGDAENLPLADASCDVVMNVESSHCYGDVGRFFREVVRVLRPGGHFAYADLRTAAEMDALTGTLASVPGWEQVERVDITGHVVGALSADDVRKRRLIDELVPARMRHIFGEFAGLSGGKVFEGFRKREMVYHRFLFRKKR